MVRSLYESQAGVQGTRKDILIGTSHPPKPNIHPVRSALKSCYFFLDVTHVTFLMLTRCYLYWCMLQDPNIVIAAMDATAHTVPKDFSVQVRVCNSLLNYRKI